MAWDDLQVCILDDFAVLNQTYGFGSGCQMARYGMGWAGMQSIYVSPMGHALGEKHRDAKLTEAIVREIRRSEKSTGELAKELGVDRKTVREARNGVTWRHVK